MVSWSQSRWRGFSIVELVQARITGLHRACGKRLLKLGKRCILGYNSQRLFSDSANSISGRLTLLFCQFRNVFQEDHYDNDLLP